jgi:hypothetical protein
MSASDFAPFVKILRCGCTIHAEFPLHAPDNVRIEWCRLHGGATALRNVVRWIHRNEAFWVPLPEAEERILYALEAVGDTA